MPEGLLFPATAPAGHDADFEFADANTVLLIESNIEQAALAQAQIECAEGDRTFVIHVDSLAAALVCLARDEFDAVLVNPNLADCRGADTIILLMQQALDVPVIALCDPDDEPLAIEALHYGVQDIVDSRRLEQENIQRIIRYARERHRLHASIEGKIRTIDSVRRRCRSVVDDNADAMVVVDEEGIVCYANPAACRLLAKDTEDFVGTPFGLPIEGNKTSEVDIVLPGQTSLVADIRAMKTKWDGNPAYIATMRDITAKRENEENLKLAEEAARQAAKLKSEFLANVGHELRTPLNAVIGFADLLLLGVHGPVGDPRYEDYLTHIKSAGATLLDLLNDLLFLSKAEAGKLDLCEQRVDYGTIVASLINELSPAAASAGCRITTSIGPDDVTVWGDPEYLEQGLRRVLQNAMELADGKGEIRIASNPVAGGGQMIAVEDDGAGIPAEDVPLIFDAFARLDDPYCIDGCGDVSLNLPIARQLIERHGGSIGIDSAVGRGTKICLTFPSNRVLRSDQAHPLYVVNGG